MRIAVIAAHGVGDFRRTFAKAGADAVCVDHDAPLVTTQFSGVKPNGPSDTLMDLVRQAGFIILPTLSSCTTGGLV